MICGISDRMSSLKDPLVSDATAPWISERDAPGIYLGNERFMYVPPKCATHEFWKNAVTRDCKPSECYRIMVIRHVAVRSHVECPFCHEAIFSHLPPRRPTNRGHRMPRLCSACIRRDWRAPLAENVQRGRSDSPKFPVIWMAPL